MSDFVNPGLHEGLKAAVEAMEAEERALLVSRAEAEEKIRLSLQQQRRLSREVKAWEGETIFVQDGLGAEPVRYHCHRVGVTFLRVSQNGKEPFKLERKDGQVVRNNFQRLVDMFTDKIEDTVESAQKVRQNYEAEKAKLLAAMHDEMLGVEKKYLDLLGALNVQVTRRIEQVEKRLENNNRFRARVFDTGVRMGVILPPPRHAGGSST